MNRPAPNRAAQWSALPGRILAEAEALVCWVYAAPGAGKTCAVQAWAEQVPAPVHWHEVREEDREPIHSALVLRRLFAGAHDPGLEDFRARLRADLRVTWELLLDELDARLVEPTWIVLDGLDKIDGLEQHPVWSTLLLRQFRQLRFVVSSRKTVPGNWSRWLVNRHIVCFGFEDLRWSAREVQAWLQVWGAPDALGGAQAVASILEDSQGWGAGVEYLVRRRKAQGECPATLGMVALWRELEGLGQRCGVEAHTWAQLRALAELERVGSDLVAELDESGRMMDLLNRLAGRGFLVKLDGRDRSSGYRFHPMFSTLLARAGQVRALDPHERQRLAQVYASYGRIQEGLTLLAKAQCWSAFVDMLEQFSPSLRGEASLEGMAASLAELPEHFAQDPERRWILVLRGLSLQGRDDATAVQLMQEALRDNALSLDCQAVALDALVHMSIAQGQDYSRVLGYIDSIDHLLEHAGKGQLSRARRLELLLCAITGALLVCPQHPKHEQWRARVLSFPAEAFEGPKAATLAATVVQKYALTGWVEYARQVYNRLRWCEGASAHRTTRIAIRVSRFFIGVISGSLVELLDFAEELDAFWAREPDAMWRSETQTFTAFAALCIGDRNRLANVLAKRNAPCAGASPFFSLCEPLLQSLVGASNSDYEKIFEGERQSLAEADRLGVCFYQCVVRACMALNLMEFGRIEEGNALLEQAREMSERFGMPVSSWTVSLVQAYRALIHKDQDLCSRLLKSVFSTMREAGCFTLPLHFHRGYSDLLAFALEQGIEVEFLTDLIRRTKKYHHYVESPAWPPKFELGVLGAFSLRIDGQERSIKFRQAAHRFELMTALMYLGGTRVAQDELIACVWPHVRGDARARLRQAIRRLSQSLGRNDAIIWSEGTVSLNPKLWRFDLWELEKDLQTLQSELRSGKGDELELRRSLLSVKARAERDFVGPTQLPSRLSSKEGSSPQAGANPEQLRNQYQRCAVMLLEK